MKAVIRITLATLIVLSFATMASAQATRTWISATGADANPCSRTAPCLTYSSAISKTATNGIINSIDSSSGGAVTITKSIQIDSSPEFGHILGSGTNGIIINITDPADTAKTVIIRGIDIHGANTGFDGIRILSANKVIIENCRIERFTGQGIDIVSAIANTQVIIRNCRISNNTQQGISATFSGSGSTFLYVEDSDISQNGSSAIDLIANAKGVVGNCHLISNGSAGVFAEAGTTDGDVAFTKLEGNVIGLSAGAGATIRLYNSHLTHNTTSVSGNVLSHGNNAVVGNNVNNLPALLPAPPLQ